MRRRDLLKYFGAAGVALHPTAKALAAMSDSGNSRTSVFLNQIGYLPQAAKLASVSGPSEDKNWFRVRSVASGTVAFEGKLGAVRSDAASGDQVAIADFSGLRTPGSYRLEVEGSASDPFPIGATAYARALRLTMRSYYGQRCGCHIDLGDGYTHPKCHIGGAFHPSSGKSGPIANHGGWHDAGDYGRYIVNSGYTVGALLWAWELFPRSVGRLDLAVPESGGKTPDYLSEIRWNLDWMLTLQDADGGVWHKQTSENFCGFIMPQDDHLISYVIGTGAAPYKSTCATADLAAVMAIAARCYHPYDAAFAQRCLAAARLGWQWALANPQVTFQNPPGVGTGDYGDVHCGDEFAWASAELWRTTGDDLYQRAFLAAVPPDAKGLHIEAPSTGSLLSMACWTYTLAARPGLPAIKQAIHDNTVGAAKFLIDRAGPNGYGNTLGMGDYFWGSNGVVGNQSLLLLMADHFGPDPAFREAALGNLHYLLGRNCHGVSWVTQLGVRPFQHPHHRPSAADGIAAPWPGLLSGGPTSGSADAVARALPKGPPMRRWVDDARAYSLNEVAINWNAPLVFLLAAANSLA